MTSNKKTNLDSYEQNILDLYEKGQLNPVAGETDYQTIARTTLKKNCKINIRLPENDLIAIKKKSRARGYSLPDTYWQHTAQVCQRLS